MASGKAHGANQSDCDYAGEDNLKEKKANNVGGLGGHKRSLSGNILSRLPFLRSSFEGSETPGDPLEPTKVQENGHARPDRVGGKVMATAKDQQKKPRRRKGSLRKTALLGTGKMQAEGRERRPGTLLSLETDIGDKPADQEGRSSQGVTNGGSPRLPGDIAGLHSFRFPSADLVHGDAPHSNGHLSSPPDAQKEIGRDLQSFATSPTTGETSTTDEEDLMTFSRQSVSTLHKSLPLKDSASSGSDSYFPPQLNNLQRRKSTNRATSPLSALPISPSTPSGEWNYADTEWWGWVILLVTWVVFVVGMGSCFEVWSWAWDVGETPYAPPELEDDPTLPIVGYYPALIILTTVMAWVWVVVAWMGMKYFKHAKISGEDI
ncbi:MAG: hypothetical protein M1837_002519 [Sclerophora amabilis]|nr:MAG: hypothetical protein M1837_002519 [Sclerophora amabilis]